MQSKEDIESSVTFFDDLINQKKLYTADPPPDSDSDGLVQYYQLTLEDVKSLSEFEEVRQYIMAFASLLRLTYIPLADKKKLDNFNYAVWKELYDKIYAFGFSLFRDTESDYYYEQTAFELNRGILTTVFNALAMPNSVVDKLFNFMQGIGQTIKLKWSSDKQMYKDCWVTACHEGVKDSSGTLRDYLPKLKYYYVEITASKRETTTNCSKNTSILYDFKYRYITMVFDYKKVFNTPDLKKIIDETLSKIDKKFAEDSSNYFDDLIPKSVSCMYDNFDEAMERVAYRIKHPL